MNDVAFRAVVDGLIATILHLELTPAEVREAAVYACIRVEEMRIPRYVISADREGAIHRIDLLKNLLWREDELEKGKLP